MRAAGTGAHPVANARTYTAAFVFTHACSVSDPDALPDATAYCASYAVADVAPDARAEPCALAGADARAFA